MGAANNVTSNPPVGINCVYFTGSTAYATNMGSNEPTPPCGNLGSNPKTTWFRFRAPTLGGVDITLRTLFNGNPTNFSNLIAAYAVSSDPCTGNPTYTNLGCSTNGVLTMPAASSILAPYAGQYIYVQLAGNGPTSPTGNYKLSIQAVPQNIVLSNPATSSITVTLPTTPGATNAPAAPVGPGCGNHPAGTYTIKKGDNFWQLKKDFCVSLGALLTANNWPDQNGVTFIPGQVINIPAAGS
jgi:LysM repeat protein